jgi:hypothetical protein
MAANGNEIIVRKRKYRQDLSKDSSKVSRTELIEFKKGDFSPASHLYLDAMIEIFDEMDGLSKHEDVWQVRQQKLLRLEAMLDDRLAKDIKYRETRTEFQKMTSMNMLLRYGDYFKGNLHILKQKAQQMAKNSEKPDLLAGMMWNDISIALKKEAKDQAEWIKNHEAGKDEAVPSHAITDLIKELAGQALMPLSNAVFQIHEYAKRCDSAHSGIDEAIMQSKWMSVAHFIVRDRIALENGVLPHDMKGDKEAFMTAIEIFEKRYFACIVTGEEPETRITIPIDFTKSDTLLQMQKEAGAAKLKNKMQAAKMKTCQEALEKAKATETDDQHLLEAKMALIESSELLEKAKAATKKAQAALGMLEVDFKGYVAKFRKIEQEKQKEDGQENELQKSDQGEEQEME